MAIVVMTVLLAALFLAAADLLHHKSRAFNGESVADLAQGTLTRAEIATDYAIIRLGPAA
jgi:hypothetical protein